MAVMRRRDKATRVDLVHGGMVVVGTARFELATYGTQNRRATRLRYAPNALSLTGVMDEEKGKLTTCPIFMIYLVYSAAAQGHDAML